MTDLEIVKRYFKLSNISDFKEIEKLLSDTTIYISQNAGKYFGKINIIKMQREFHAKFNTLNWSINSLKTLAHGTIVVDYDFKAKQQSGENIKSTGLEFISVKDDLIRRIEIQNKP
ncbi:MAG TPA: hypothetical protein VIH90_08455 [Candidatus Saccharimonadales bacterium]